MDRKQTEAKIAELVNALRQRPLSKSKEQLYKSDLAVNLYALLKYSQKSHLRDLVKEGTSEVFARTFRDALKTIVECDEDGAMFLKHFYAFCKKRKSDIINAEKGERVGIDYDVQSSALKLYFNELCKKCGKKVSAPNNVWSPASIERFFSDNNFTAEEIAQARDDIDEIRKLACKRLDQDAEDDKGDTRSLSAAIEYEHQGFVGKNDDIIETILDKLDLVRQSFSHDKNKNEVMKYIRYFVTMKLVKSGFFDTGGAQMTNVLWDDYVSKELIEYWKEHADFRKNDAEIVASFLNLKPDTVRKKLKKAEKCLASVDQKSR